MRHIARLIGHANLIMEWLCKAIAVLSMMLICSSTMHCSCSFNSKPIKVMRHAQAGVNLI